jgi:hypothetical protein
VSSSFCPASFCLASFCLASVCLASLGAGCDDLSDYSGDFEGSIVRGNFVRRCFPATTRAELSFDPELAVAPVDPSKPSKLNRLTTTDGTFNQTLLEPIAALPHDQLSELDFPGPSRLRNFILLARPTSGPLVGHDATVVVSLLENRQVELRVIARTATTHISCPTESEDSAESEPALDTQNERPREYFGVFILK